MGNENTSRNECYECGTTEIAHRSMLPLVPHFVEREGDGSVKSARGFNGDFNVCAPCYVKQWKEVYPDEEVPAKVLAAAGGD